MALLIAEVLEPEVIGWLEARHPVRYVPQLADDPLGFRAALHDVRGLIAPPALALDATTLRHAPVLRAVGRVRAGAENIDLEACARAGVAVVRSLTASAQAEAEFMVHALLLLLRRFPVAGADGSLAGRELGACTVGLIGMAPAARSMSQVLGGFGARVVGYDPGLHRSDGVWARWQVLPMSLRDLLQEADALCVQLPYFSRYRGLFGERLLSFCKPDQVIVSLSHSALFDDTWLADALVRERLAAVWLDRLEPGALDPGRPLHGIERLRVSPNLASTTRESHLRRAWAVARRIDELLLPQAQPPIATAEGMSLANGPLAVGPGKAGVVDDR
jgi:phosphoglycerate dehydrogenase-like enzyme